MARIYQRGKTWYLDYRVDGEHIRKPIGTNKKLAEVALKDIELKLFKGEIKAPKPKKKILEFIDEFLKSYKATMKPTTYNRYRAVMDHFTAFLEDNEALKTLDQVSPAHIEQFKLYRLESVTHKTANFELSVVRTLFNHAKKFGYIGKNPVTNIQKIRTSRKQPRFFSEEEIAAIMEVCDDYFKALFSTLLCTGIRRGELKFLEWSDIDFEKGIIKIQVKDYWEPKGRRSREIPIHDKLRSILEKHKQKYGNNRWVFTKDNGEQLDHLWRRFQSILKKADVKDATVHTWRHTFASHLVMAGVDVPTVQKLMGHRDIQTTMIYAHLAPDHLKTSLNRLEF